MSAVAMSGLRADRYRECFNILRSSSVLSCYGIGLLKGKSRFCSNTSGEINKSNECRESERTLTEKTTVDMAVLLMETRKREKKRIEREPSFCRIPRASGERERREGKWSEVFW